MKSDNFDFAFTVLILNSDVIQFCYTLFATDVFFYRKTEPDTFLTT
jgi:hypothetical protein